MAGKRSPTTISIHRQTLERLRAYKVAGASYDDLINDLLATHPPEEFFHEHVRRLRGEKRRPWREIKDDLGRDVAACAPSWISSRRAPGMNSGAFRATRRRVFRRRSPSLRWTRGNGARGATFACSRGSQTPGDSGLGITGASMPSRAMTSCSPSSATAAPCTGERMPWFEL